MNLVTPPVSVLPSAKLIVGSERRVPGDGRWFEHRYPATGQTTEEVPLGGRSDVNDAVDAARGAQLSWRNLRPDGRRDVMLRLADLIEADADRLTTLQVLENGMPVAFASRFVANAVDLVRYNAGWADKVQGEVVPTWPGSALDYTLPEPYGVVGIIIPWNGPLVSVAQTTAPAIAAGNCVVLKPSELAPWSALRFAELALKAGVPPGVINVLPGDGITGDALVRHPGIGMVHFTGSGATAQKVLAGAAEHLAPVSLELGGKSPSVIFEDADVRRATRAATRGILDLSGQGCLNSTRILCARSIFDEVVSIASETAAQVVIGDPTDPKTQVGPVISAEACDRIMVTIEAARSSGHGELVTGGERVGGDLAGGWFISPAVFAGVPEDAKLAREEIFGPVLTVLAFDDEEEALRLANGTPYGLASYVYSSDVRRVNRMVNGLESGMVWVNGFTGLPTSAPFGGVKSSGYGRIGGRAGVEEFTRTKNVWIAS
ncbi:aldehyde dehydrogenase family protein [Rhodococcus opacus]|nr:aldehyde dehydrogenase family protein [Rhodococcus opacus]